MYENELRVMRLKLGLSDNASLDEISTALENRFNVRAQELERRRNRDTSFRADLLEQAEAAFRDVNEDIENLKKMRAEIEKAEQEKETEERVSREYPAGDGELATKRYLKLISDEMNLNLTDEEIDKLYKEEQITKDGKTYKMEKRHEAQGYDDYAMDEFVIRESKAKEKEEQERNDEVEYEPGEILASLVNDSMLRGIKQFSDEQKLDLSDEEISEFIKTKKITKDGKTYIIEQDDGEVDYGDNVAGESYIRELKIKEKDNANRKDKEPAGPEDTTAEPGQTPAGPEDTTAEPGQTPAGPKDTTAEPGQTPAGPEDTGATPEPEPVKGGADSNQITVSKYDMKYDGKTGNYYVKSTYSNGEKVVELMGRFSEAEKTSTKKRISELLKDENIKSFIERDDIPEELKKKGTLKKADPTLLRFLCTYGSVANDYKSAVTYLNNLLHKKNDKIKLYGKELSLAYDIPLEDKKLSFMMKMAKSHKKMAEIKKPSLLERMKNTFSKIKESLLPSKEEPKQLQDTKTPEQQHEELLNEMTPEQKAHMAEVIEARKAAKNEKQTNEVSEKSEEEQTNTKKMDAKRKKALYARKTASPEAFRAALTEVQAVVYDNLSEKQKIEFRTVEPEDRDEWIKGTGIDTKAIKEVIEADKKAKEENKFGKLTPEEQKEMEANIAEKNFRDSLNPGEKAMYEMLSEEKKASFKEAKKNHTIGEWVKAQSLNIDEIKNRVAKENKKAEAEASKDKE